jgi:hypothetical protein
VLQQLNNAIVVRAKKNLVQSALLLRGASLAEQLQSGNPSINMR